MRIKDILQEGRTGSLQKDVAAAIPSAFVIPKLPNQDPYKQYRFGLALAAARAKKAKDQENTPEFSSESLWGENAVIISYSNTTKDIIDDALKHVGLSSSDKKQITTTGSNETTDVEHGSPVAKPKRNRWGV